MCNPHYGTYGCIIHFKQEFLTTVHSEVNNRFNIFKPETIQSIIKYVTIAKLQSCSGNSLVFGKL